MEHGRLTRSELEGILEKIRSVRICVIGDLCLDLYWYTDMTHSRLSRESLRPTNPIVEEVCSPGAAGNVIGNAVSLGAKGSFLLSATARDWRGALLRRQLTKRGIALDDVLELDRGFTPCFCRTLDADRRETSEEIFRLDFAGFEPMCSADEDRFLALLDAAAVNADIIAVCDQLEYGIITKRVRDKLSALSEKLPIVVDSRERITEFTGVIVKPNEVEAAAASGREPYTHWELDVYEEIACGLQKRNDRPAIVTLGARGSLWAEGRSVRHLSAAVIEPPYDPIGAGDAFLAAFCAAYAAIGNGVKSAAFANLAAAVTVRKTGITGTATPDEILSLWSTQP